jgi:hypothetical protein
VVDDSLPGRVLGCHHPQNRHDSLIHPSPTQPHVVVALALALTSPHWADATSPCDPGWTYFPDVDLTEYSSALPVNGERKYGGSCLRPEPQDGARGDQRPPVCHRGPRHLLLHLQWGPPAVNSLDTGPNALLPVIKGLMAAANTTLVLTGGFQNPNAKGWR